MGYDSDTLGDAGESFDGSDFGTGPGPTPGGGVGGFDDGGGQPQGGATIHCNFRYAGDTGGTVQIVDATTGSVVYSGPMTFGMTTGALPFVPNPTWGAATITMPTVGTKSYNDIGDGDRYIP